MRTEYIHYGSTELLPIQKIRNQKHFSKPVGGIWASPVDAEFGWKDWCEREHFRTCELSNSFKFILKEDAKIFHIYSVSDLKKLPIQDKDEFSGFFLISQYYLDFEKIEKEYDGIELHLSEESFEGTEFGQGLYFSLYGWDCDSIILFHDSAIKRWWN